MKTIDCEHWRRVSEQGGTCAIEKFGKNKEGGANKLSHGMCVNNCKLGKLIDDGKPVQVTVNRGGVVEAVPRERWPKNCESLAVYAIESDKGLGDVAARLIAQNGLAALDAVSVIAGEFGKLKTLTAAFTWLTGRGSCGCSDRQARLNLLYPLA